MSDHTPIRDGNYTAIKCDGSWYILKYIGSDNVKTPYTSSLFEVIGDEADGVQVVVPQEVVFSLTYFEEINEVNLDKIVNNCRNIEYSASFIRVQLELRSALRKDESP